MEDYGVDDFDDYYLDDNSEIAEGSGTSTETFNSLATTKPSIQTTLDNVESLTENLIVHLKDCHGIVSQDNIGALRKKQCEEVVLKWMLLTNQPLSIVIDEAYKEKIAAFDPSFTISEEKKIRTMIAKSYNYNRENLKNLLNQTVKNVSLIMDLWSSRAKHGYLEITAT
ncbi:5873_t:CDS:2 [Cetraspora pellucida]|uniref:5873_t:CDS:1 n=1 Tax=Cetraspora pellucida TaxID=1433469 RepID=A0ACA9LK25_9GLOM|nr:5873_t:CDS:2 [Cetraspora pellucida]